MNHANTALYGVVNAVVLTLCLPPGIGIIHQSNRQAFVLDIADLYKAEVTIPLSFSLHRSSDAGRDATLAVREQFRLLRLITRIVGDIYAVLDLPADGGTGGGDWDVNELFLWSPEESSPPALRTRVRIT